MSTQLSRRAFGNIDAPPTAEGRSLTGLALPFNTETAIVGPDGRTFRERFEPGAFARSIAARPRVPLRAQHDGRAFPIGTVNRLVETARGLEIEAVIADTARGNEALELLRQGVVSGLSIGGNIISQETRNGVVVVTEIDLHEISLVDAPAYQTARVETLRSIDAALARIAAYTPAATPRATLAAARIRIHKGN